MAELLHAKEWFEPSPLGFFLRETLPDGYFVVADPTVLDVAMDAVVVGPQGLVVLYARDWEGQIRPTRRGPWRGVLPSGQKVRHPNPANDARRAGGALQTFLEDEFRTVRVPVAHMVVLTSPEASLTTDGKGKLQVVTEETIGPTLTFEPLEGGDLLDGGIREDLAVALRDRRFTRSQRASKPFVFRSGGAFGSGKKAWTLREVASHMDRYPDDGIFHLRNGTLAQWLTEQGAEHLAYLAVEATRSIDTDPRVPLERFLVESGLVPRPEITVRPERLSMGYVLAGESCTSHFRLKGKGRGYPFGKLRTSDPWLRVDPKTFSGGLFEAVVAVDTQALSISRTPWKAEVLIDSNASEEPLALPVSLRVVGQPSRMDRVLYRPLAGALYAALLGAGIGWTIGRWAFPQASSSTAVGSVATSSTVFWALLVGLVWAVMGWIRGRNQPLAWPPAYSYGSWIVRMLAWAAAFSVLALAGQWIWRGFTASVSFAGGSAASVVSFATALAIFPATAGEVRSAQRSEGRPPPPTGRLLRPALVMTIAGLALGLVLVVGGQLLRPAVQEVDVSGTVTTSQGWLTERWLRLEKVADGLIDDLVIYYHERQRPGPVPAAITPIFTPVPPSASGEDGEP
jgi:hypothetical protein